MDVEPFQFSCLGVCNVIFECFNYFDCKQFYDNAVKTENCGPEKLASLQIKDSVDFLNKIQIKDVMALIKAKLIVNNVILDTNNIMEFVDDCLKQHILHMRLLR